MISAFSCYDPEASWASEYFRCYKWVDTAAFQGLSWLHISESQKFAGPLRTYIWACSEDAGFDENAHWGLPCPHCSDPQMSAGLLSCHARGCIEVSLLALMRLPIGGFPAPTALIFRCQLGFSKLVLGNCNEMGLLALMRLPIGGFPAPTALIFGCQLGF